MMQKVRHLMIAIILSILIGLTFAGHGTHQVSAFDQMDLPADAQVDQTTATGDSYGATNQRRFEEISSVLEQIPTGRATLALLDQFHINVHFDTGHGSRFYKERNIVVINAAQGNFSAALSLVHETTHARYFHEALTATADHSDRQTYIQMKLEEEITAVENQIRAATELSATGVDVSRLHHVLYYQYLQAAGKASRTARYNNPSLNESALKEISQEAGREAVAQSINSGEFVRSTDGQTYADYWGSLWDTINNL